LWTLVSAPSILVVFSESKFKILVHTVSTAMVELVLVDGGANHLELTGATVQVISGVFLTPLLWLNQHWQKL